MGMACAMGMRSGVLSVAAAIKIWNTLVRSVLEYGAEVWGTEKWEDAEKIQRKMGRRILGIRENANNEVVYGELGWWRLSTRRDLLRLRYWAKILTMKESRLTKIVYEWERKNNRPRTWCRYTEALLSDLGLSRFWTAQVIQYSSAEWGKIVGDKLHAREQE